MSSGLDSDIRQSARLVNWCTALAALAVGICLVMLTTGCGSTYKPTAHQPAPPDRSAAVATVAGGVGESAGKIDAARADAVAKAPEVQPESERIGEQTARLRQYQVDLELVAGDLKATKAHVDGLTKSLAAAEKDAAEARAEVERAKAAAESKWKAAMYWVLAGIFGTAILLGVAALIWLKNMPLVVGCAVTAVVCVGASKLIDWGPQIAVGCLVLLACGGAYAFWRYRKTIGELVLTAEHFKIGDPKQRDAMVAAAEAIQSSATKAFVKSVRDPIKKKLAEAKAFAGSV